MVSKRNHCDTCNWKLDYIEKRDAYYCANCNEWKEYVCDDEDCGFCGKRPETPMITESSIFSSFGWKKGK